MERERYYNLLRGVVLGSRLESAEKREIIQMLSEQEDAEEQGLLAKFSCKCGDTVYIIYDREIHEATATNVLRYQGQPFVQRIYVRFAVLDVFYNDGRMAEYQTFGDLGIEVFLTKAEARQALASMKCK